MTNKNIWDDIDIFIVLDKTRYNASIELNKPESHLTLGDLLPFIEKITIQNQKQFYTTLLIIANQIKNDERSIKLDEIMKLISMFQIGFKTTNNDSIKDYKKCIINFNKIPKRNPNPKTTFNIPEFEPSQKTETPTDNSNELIAKLQNYTKELHKNYNDNILLREILILLEDTNRFAPDGDSYIEIAQKFNHTFPERVPIETLIKAIRKYDITSKENAQGDVFLINIDNVPQKESAISTKNTKQQMYDYILELENIIWNNKVDTDQIFYR